MPSPKIRTRHPKQTGLSIEAFSYVKASTTRVGVVRFFVYFITLLSGLYRYTIRLAAFCAPGDALSLMVPLDVSFNVLVEKLAPDALSFGKQGVRVRSIRQ